MIKNIGYKTYIVFMCFCIVGLLYAIFILPELKGLTLEEVDEIFVSPPHLSPLSTHRGASPSEADSSTTPLVPKTKRAASASPSRLVWTRSPRT